jgi:AcrR family transcriptional regulator
MTTPAPPPRIRDPEGTVDKLTDAALALFAQSGFERATVDQIVARAGFSKGAFYAHFRSKEELFLHILERRLERNLERVQLLCRSDGPAAVWLTQLLETLIDVSPESQPMRSLSMEYMAHGMRHPQIGARIAAMHERWRDLFAATLRRSPEHREGRMRGTPEAIATTFVALIDGLIVQIALDPEAHAKETLMADVAPLLHAWFAPPNAGDGA